jgi:hypothetical protein
VSAFRKAHMKNNAYFLKPLIEPLSRISSQVRNNNIEAPNITKTISIVDRNKTTRLWTKRPPTAMKPSRKHFDESQDNTVTPVND